MIPAKAFITKGVGVHKDKLASFELALRDAGIEKQNLVYVSSILPPNCKIISKEDGVSMLKPGQITFCVMARIETDEPKRLISSAVGLAMPENENNYGYISEHHSYGESEESAGEYAEDLAATMLASTLGIQFDSGQAWVEREQVYKASGQIIETTHCVKSAIGAENGQWTTVISAVVFCGYQ